MADELDINKVAAELLNENMERFVEAAGSSAKGLKNRIRAQFEGTYRGYIARLLERYGKGKSFFVRSEPISIYQFFVPLNLITQVRILRQPDAADITNVAPFAILTGTGGSGKSMMMKHVLISAIKAGTKTPIFFELRQLNQREGSLRDALLRTLQTNGLTVDEAYFEIALAAGHFLILLDGFDEIEHSKRKRVAREVQDLAIEYHKNWIVMSSRPDSALDGWDSFVQLRIAPLDLDSATELVAKLPFEDPVKERFIADMRDTLFARHRSFLSNPLLLSIMLLTYSDVAHIPHKLSTFYSQAYESLFHRHDALKGGFQRERRSGLDIQDFGRAFASFSLLTYDKREFAFTAARALELLETSRSISMLQFEEQAFLDDTVQAVCLLLEDGMELTFAHRSFQEYFVARYINASPTEVKAKLVRRFGPSVESDSVMALLYEIDPYIVERYYILPSLGSLRKKIGVTKTVRTTHFLRYLKTLFADFRRAEADGGTVSAVINDLGLYLAQEFAHNRYRKPRDEIAMSPDSVAALRSAYLEEFGDVPLVSAKAISQKGPFVKACSTSGGVWGIDYLQTSLQIELEIQARHDENLESLEAALT